MTTIPTRISVGFADRPGPDDGRAIKKRANADSKPDPSWTYAASGAAAIIESVAAAIIPTSAQPMPQKLRLKSVAPRTSP